MRLRKVSVLIAANASFVACFNAVSAETEIAVIIRDVRNGAPVASQVACSIGSSSIDLKPSPAGGFETGKVLLQTGDVVRLDLEAGEQYAQRKVALRELPNPKRNVLVLYVARRLPQYTYQYLDQGLEYHSRGEFDRALAHYESAFLVANPGPSMTQFDLKLKYNYGRGLANTCLRAGYFDCDEAKQVYEELKSAASVYQPMFVREGISVAELERTIADIDAAKVRMRYTAFKDLFDSGVAYEAAGSEAEKLLSDFDTKPEAFQAVRLTKDRLREDAAVAYARAADDSAGSNTSGNKVLLDKSLRQFNAIGKKSPAIEREVRAATERMSRLP